MSGAFKQCIHDTTIYFLARGIIEDFEGHEVGMDFSEEE